MSGLQGILWFIAKWSLLLAFIAADWSRQWVPGSWASAFAVTFKLTMCLWFLINLTEATLKVRKADDHRQTD